MKKTRRAIDRSIAGLAFPAFGALVAEPLFLAIDSALIGHLGAVPLAGLAIASAVLSTAIGLMVFLAYSTTPLVARRRGAGDSRGAVQAGVDGLWLALAIGLIIALAMWVLRSDLVGLFGGESAVAEQAVIYLGISALGMPAMLIVFAATGLLRGMLDTHTPLIVAVLGFALNAGLSWLFIYGFRWGIAGSAWGTVIAQWLMVASYLVVVVRHARAHGVGWLPELSGLKYAGRSGGWLFLRTLGLRVALLATVGAVATHGVATTAAYQVVFLIISITAFMLDALAIAAQALIGDALGAANEPRVRLVLSRTLFWGVVSGLGIGLVVAVLSPLVGRVFTSDPSVLQLLTPAIAAVGLTLPLAAIVYVLDGVLMGAGDARYLAIVSLGALVLYLPLLFTMSRVTPEGAPALLAITLSFTLGLMLIRALTLTLRARSGRWITLGGTGR